MSLSKLQKLLESVFDYTLKFAGPAYDDLLDEFMEAAVATFGQNVLIQFEDFAYQNAYRLIQKYQYKVKSGATPVVSISGKTRAYSRHKSLLVGQ